MTTPTDTELLEFRRRLSSSTPHPRIMTEIDLSKYVGQRVYVKHRDGSQEINILTKDNHEVYPFDLGSDSYTQSGAGQEDGEDQSDIIEIYPADQVTVLKWFQSANRKPTWDDAHDGFIQVCDTTGVISSCISWSTDPPSSLWTHCPGWRPPQPEPEPLSKAEQIRQQLQELQARLDKLEAHD